MTVKEKPEKLISTLVAMHADIEEAINIYLEEYAEYGWDSVCEELKVIAAGMDALGIMLRCARTQAELEKEKGNAWRF